MVFIFMSTTTDPITPRTNKAKLLTVLGVPPLQASALAPTGSMLIEVSNVLAEESLQAQTRKSGTLPNHGTSRVLEEVKALKLYSKGRDGTRET